MKKILLVILLIIMLVMGMAPTLFAAEHPANLPTVKGVNTVLKAEEENMPGILPTNPFYFIKEWGRGVKRAITFNPVSKAEFELKVASHKAAELRKIAELDPNNTRAIKVAIQNYSEDASRLKAHLNVLAESELVAKINEEISKIEALQSSLE